MAKILKNKMQVRLSESWKSLLETEFDKDYFKNLTDFVRQEYTAHQCYPRGGEIFAALDHCPVDQVKVVIIGQDPYHGPKQANGLCFSVHDPLPHPPSLINIFKELSTDLGKPYRQSGDLSSWAQQGVLLLNATLTVRAGQAGSHQNKGWELFTDQIIRKVSEQRGGLVFLLWGGFARKKAKLVDQQKHKILACGHPSPLSANRGYWFGNKHFSQTNAYLQGRGIAPIQW